MRTWTLPVTFMLLAVSLSAQDSCIPYILTDCTGNAQQFECAQVTTGLTNDQGGASSRILQEYCFKVDSPLFGGINEETGVSVIADKGSLDFTSLTEGDAIGELSFAVKLSDFGEDCPQGDDATLNAPITITEVSETFLTLEVVIAEASVPIIECLLIYDPTDQEHNNGRMLEGEIAKIGSGGFEFFLHLATPDGENLASYPGMEYGDIMGLASPVPLFFKPITRDGIFILPAAGGTLTLTTTLSAENESGEIVSTDPFEEEFIIKPGVVVDPPFRRGDVNDDGQLNIADAISVLGHLFGGDPAPSCSDAADANDDGLLNIADAISILGYLFGGGSIQPPGDVCGPDPTGNDTLPECVYEKC